MNPANQPETGTPAADRPGRFHFQFHQTALPLLDGRESAPPAFSANPFGLRRSGEGMQPGIRRPFFMRFARLPYHTFFAFVLLVQTVVARADDTVTWQLLPSVKVDSTGIFLTQLVVPSPSSSVVSSSSVALPQIRLAPAPHLGQTASLSRSQITELVQKQASELITSNWSGATQVRITRRTRQFTDSEMTEMLSATLQREYVKDRGELELHLNRPFATILVPDEELTLKVIDLPATGVSPNFVARCELWNDKERVGDWQLSVLARVWHEIPIAHSRLNRGQLVRDADITLERRDILVQRDAYTDYSTADTTLELTEAVAAGMPVLSRSVRVRPVIQRGRMVDGVYRDGTLSISMKVEAMEDGSPGQTVRVRNLKTKRDLYGKVQNEQTVLISL